MDSTFFPFVAIVMVWAIFALVAAAVLIRNRTRFQVKRYHSIRRQYTPGDFSPQMELDLRLPYRRFKQLYPSSGLDYEAYKKLQAQRSFRRSMSSQDNKRMVR